MKLRVGLRAQDELKMEGITQLNFILRCPPLGRASKDRQQGEASDSFGAPKNKKTPAKISLHGGTNISRKLKCFYWIESSSA